jgi:hypothetical protein
VEAYFNARDTNADVRCLDHADIICTITDGKKDRLEVLLDQFDNKGFLQWRNATWGVSSN